MCVVVVLGLAGCMRIPEKSSTQALFVDLRKTEQLSEDAGWTIDRLELEDNLETALRSVCLANEETRQDLAEFLEREIDALGGSAELQYAKNGGDIDELSDVLSLERTAMLLELAREHAAEDCPFYMQPQPDFSGVENDLERLTVWVESQGFGAVLFERGSAALSGGGALRILLGHNLSARWTLAVGGEFGANGTLTGNKGAADQLDTALIAATPVVLRLTDLSRIFDLEVTPVVRFNQGEKVLPPGVRTTIGGGLAGLRAGGFTPYLIVYAGVEWHASQPGVPSSTSLRAGTRFGVDFDP